ncbi:GMC family oxidoreductase [Mycolicibacterium sp. CBM1]
MDARNSAAFGSTAERTVESARRSYDFIVCGSGSSGSVVASRLSENPDVSVLLIEAGGSDRVPAVMDTTLWMSNIGSERDWGYKAQPADSLNGRTPLLPMGKVLGGGSSINGSVWARGHKNDFDMWAAESGDDGWNYQSVLGIYRSIEDWQGAPDLQRRGKGGLLNIVSPQDPIPLVAGLVSASEKIGIPFVDDINGTAMEGEGGCGLPNVLVQQGNTRVSMAATYLHPHMDRPNLDILLHAEITSLAMAGSKVTGVRFVREGKAFEVGADREVILSLGAINTPKILMLSGIGPDQELRRHGIEVVANLPGVGKNFQDHILLAGCCFEYVTPEPPRNNAAEFVFFAKSHDDLETPDLMPVLEEIPFGSEVTSVQYALPVGAASAWTLAPGLARPDSRGEVVLASADPSAAPLIFANFLSAESDMAAMIRCVEMCREIGNSDDCEPFRAREVMPGNLGVREMRDFIRDAAGTYFHQSCTAKMGRDAMSVVDSELRVYGVENLRVADASIMPAITTGNTMAPCVVIGERAARLIQATHGSAHTHAAV